jgi:hypothetical protein
VNDAVYIAKTGAVTDDPAKKWTATGAQFAEPYVFKTLFSKEQLAFDDYIQTKTVTTALYLDFTGDMSSPHFVGRAGAFVPVLPGTGGGVLLRGKDGIYHSASGAKGYFWKEADTVRALDQEEQIDRAYFDRLANEAIDNISKFGDFEWFAS